MVWWVLLFLGIGVTGLAVLAGLTVSLWRQFRALLDELGRAGDLTGELLDLLGQVQVEPIGSHPDLTPGNGAEPAVRT